MKAVIALGANLGDPKAQLTRAIEEINKLIEVTAVSSFYETEPVGVSEPQPNYFNAILLGDSDHKPLDLMRALLTIENSLGRTRSIPNAARTIDIDIIDFGGLSMASAELTLPHPRAHQRRFVLAPWFEIDPAGVLVGHGPIRELLSQLEAAK